MSCVFSPADEHLDCFQFWNIATRAAANPCIYLLVQDGLPLDSSSSVSDEIQGSEEKMRPASLHRVKARS